MMRENLKNFFATERAKLREMSFKDKRQYIWEYYKIHIIAFALIAFLVGSLINTWFINPPLRDYLYIAWFGAVVPSDMLNSIGDALAATVDNPEREQVTVMSYAITNNPSFDSGMQQRLIAMLQTGSIDLFFTPVHGVTEIAESGFSRPVHEVMGYLTAVCAALYQQVSEQLVTITFELDENIYTDAMAISLADTPLFDYLDIDASNIYLVVVANTQNFDRIANALEVIFQWNPVE
ncbi:MAG: hypothetical protein FWC32_05090 [Firmicutes bacterium]|nr:hypothetical protein [Bacillota bacterium]